MKRRDFFAATASMVLPLTINGMGVRTFNQHSSLVRTLLKTTAIDTDKILVIVNLNGGNDGLNTVIPLEHYSAYYSLRSNIAIPENRVLRLDNNLMTGLHPAMTGMRDLYNNGKLSIIHSVSYPNPDKSHTRSSEIWMTGADSDKYSETGWAGRYLQNRYDNYPDAFPNENMPDPLAVQIGYINTTTLAGGNGPMNISIDTPSNFYELLGNVDTTGASENICCDAGELVRFVKQQQVLSTAYATEIKTAGEAGSNLAPYPTSSKSNDLSEQLKIVARLIHGGLKSKIYYVELEGFDTHASQVSVSNTWEGEHARLLKQLSDAISAFQQDLSLQGNEDKVIGMTFSEFGRRATSNSSRGTDHGIAAPMFVFGSGIKKQVIGTNPDLVNDLVPIQVTSQNNSQDINMQIDFRRIYSDILKDWFGTSDAITNTLLFKEFSTTSLFSNHIETVSSGKWQDRSIWSSGRMPSPTDYVKINEGHKIQIGQNITVRNITVGGGAELSLLGDYLINTTG